MRAEVLGIKVLAMGSVVWLGLVTVACVPQVQGPTPGIDASVQRDAGSADRATQDSANTGTTITPGCNGECSALQVTVCTCHVSDPCDWIGDGYCDTNYCLQVTSTPFDDSADCTTTRPCDGACDQGQYTTCTCGAGDPCGWSGDDYCDSECQQVLPSGAFDDTADCGGPPPPPANACNGTCGNGTYDACTCAASDPCGRAGNGSCDQAACAAVLPTGAYNDSADCGGWDPSPAGTESFSLSAVYDNLDPGDLDVVGNGMPGMGFSQASRNNNVTASALASALGGNATFHYHTGHGEVGQVLTYDGTYDAGDSTINVQHTVFATCLTLQSYAWRAAMGSSAQSLFGYTEISYDYTDDEVAADMLAALRDGKGYVQAWYLANAVQSTLNDRWAAYVREGSSVVEYSARVNQAPANVQTLGLPTVALDPRGRVRALAALLDDTRRFPRDVEPAHGDAARLPRARALDAGRWSLLADGAADAKRARDRARAHLEEVLGGWPEGAVLDRVVPIWSRRDDAAPQLAGHLVRYRRELGGLPLRGNGVTDHLGVLVAGRGVVAWTIDWPERRSERVLADTLDVRSALQQVAPALARAAKGPVRVIGAAPVWGVVRGADRLVPAFALTTASGQDLVVDARAGQLLR